MTNESNSSRDSNSTRPPQRDGQRRDGYQQRGSQQRGGYQQRGGQQRSGQQRGGNRSYQKSGRSHRPAPKYVPPPPPPAEEVTALVSEISEALNEDNFEQLTKAIEIIGIERARNCLKKAVEIEANGGMMIISGKRRRTAGGVFFYMVRTDASKDERRIIFPNLFTEKAQPPSWKECNIYIAKLLQQPQKGTVSKVKLTLIGRPKQVAKAKTCMVAIMEGRPVPESMPKGLPSPPNAGSSFAVFIATKQWNRVADTLKENKDDELIIEGYPIFDPAKQVTAVLAQGVTTKITQRIGAARKKAGLPVDDPNDDSYDGNEAEEAESNELEAVEAENAEGAEAESSEAESADSDADVEDSQDGTDDEDSTNDEDSQDSTDDEDGDDVEDSQDGTDDEDSQDGTDDEDGDDENGDEKASDEDDD